MKTTIFFFFLFSLNLVCAQTFGKKGQIETLNHEVDSLKTLILELEKSLAQEKENNLTLLSSNEKVESENLILKSEKEEQINLNERLRKINDSLFIAVENTTLPVSIEEVVKEVKYEGITEEFSVSQVSILNEPELSKQINEEICLYTNLVSFHIEQYDVECPMSFETFLDQLNSAQLKQLKSYYRPIPEIGGASLNIVPTLYKNTIGVEIDISNENYDSYIYRININLNPQEKGYFITYEGFKAHCHSD